MLVLTHCMLGGYNVKYEVCSVHRYALVSLVQPTYDLRRVDTPVLNVCCHEDDGCKVS